MPKGVYVRTEYHNRINSEAQIKVWTRLEHKEIMSGIQKEVQNRPEVKEKKKKAQIKAFQNPEVRKRHKKATIKAVNQPEVVEKHSKASKEVWARFGYKKMMSKIQSAATIKRYQDPEERKKQSEIFIKLWQDPKYADNQIKATMKGNCIKPNKPELKLNDLLQQLLPNEYKYVGDGEFILAGKCPDFVNINGQKKIIELYGDYWHKGETGKERIELFKQYGYQTLIVWENELEDENLLKEKLLNFNR